MKKITLLVVYLLGFPAVGLLFGFAFFKLLDIITGPLDDIALEISLLIWFGFGLFAGIYGAVLFLRIDRLRRLSSEKEDQTAKKRD